MAILFDQDWRDQKLTWGEAEAKTGFWLLIFPKIVRKISPKIEAQRIIKVKKRNIMIGGLLSEVFMAAKFLALMLGGLAATQ